jgi:hypothetical protein
MFSRYLPIRYGEPHRRGCQSRLFTTFALQRSGQHLVIDWICRGLVDAVHLNNCRLFRAGLKVVLTPITGRRVVYSPSAIHDSGVQGRRAYRRSLPQRTPSNLVYSLENQSLEQYEIRKLLSRFHPFLIIILRDPANWLASSLRHGMHGNETLKANIKILKEYLRFANGLEATGGSHGTAINFNRFTEDESYRRMIAEKLNLVSFKRAEEALQHTPDFGGGSSFNDRQGRSNGVHDRYLEYRDDAFFREALKEPELITLVETFFGTLPGFETLRISEAGSSRSRASSNT